MGWVILAAVAAYIIFKMFSNYKQNQATEEIFGMLKKHSPDEVKEIIQWELQLRTEVAEYHQLHKASLISDAQLAESLEKVLAKHREIEKKYNVTEKEMTDYYLLATSGK